MNSTPSAGHDSTPCILVAEDHADSREALRALLEASGYEVHVAADGREAVAAALALQPDLILMDLMMPEMDGLEATRTLRGQDAFRQVPILALTALEGSQQRAIEAGCNDHLLKPMDVPTFLEKVETWLNGGPANAN